ncbi:MAG TPA: CBS domain-containing protein, partial [Spirochaetota bacterium]|nr:CBS domain-containing protein [Spirochaetota bacterium]
MEKRYIALSENTTVKNAVKHIRKAAGEDMVFYAYVVNNKGVLHGVLPLRKLLISNEEKRLREIMIRKPITISPYMPNEEIAAIFTRTKFLALPVVDDAYRIIGTITFKKAMDIIKAEGAEDLLKTQGADIGAFDKSI